MATVGKRIAEGGVAGGTMGAVIGIVTGLVIFGPAVSGLTASTFLGSVVVVE